ncbi:hypothetical protein LAT59_01100 [Candidatus Gracilibacteria bacterium]|nr:hypothetical protein [Candidatus Gracilibacteria bacterium]
MASDGLEQFDGDSIILAEMIESGRPVNWDLVTKGNIEAVMQALEIQDRIPDEVPHNIAVILNVSNFRELGLSETTLVLLEKVLQKAFSAGNLDKVLPVC